MKAKLLPPPLRPHRTVPMLLAQSPELSQAVMLQVAGSTPFLRQIVQDSSLSFEDKAVIELLYLHGLRISEVLNILPNHISPSGTIRITGSKGSSDRFVMSVLFRQYWFEYLAAVLPLSQYKTRFYFYRLCKKRGWYSLEPGRENLSVTHYFRHRIITDLHQQGYSLKQLSDFIGHRSKKSILHYVNENEKES